MTHGISWARRALLALIVVPALSFAQAWPSKPVVIVLLDSIGKYTRLGDAERVKHWMETGDAMPEAIKRVVAHTKASTSLPKSRGPVRGTFKAVKSRH